MSDLPPFVPPPSPHLPLLTPRLRLRAFTPQDEDDLFALQSREDVTQYLYWAPRGREEVARILTRRATDTRWRSEGDRLSLAVERREDGAFVGDVMLSWTSAEHRTAELGFVLHPEHHGRGFAVEASDALLRVAFDDFRLHRVIGRCDGRNTASARVMEKLGMRREAHFLRNEFVKGEWTDELVYALLSEEWQARGPAR